jgi:circadian clock protein KaiC
MNEAVRFINLGDDIVNGSLQTILGRIVQEVEATNPGTVVVDSFRTVARAAERSHGDDLDLQHFVQQLAVRLTGWEATTFLVGEYQPSEAEHNPVFTVADGLFWLSQSVDGNSMVRKLQVMKMRGQASIPGLHTFRITGDGIQVFPRVIVGPVEKSRAAVSAKRGPPRERLSLGVKGLDEMLGGASRRATPFSWLVPRGPARRCSPRNSSRRTLVMTNPASLRSSKSGPATTRKAVRAAERSSG